MATKYKLKDISSIVYGFTTQVPVIQEEQINQLKILPTINTELADQLELIKISPKAIVLTKNASNISVYKCEQDMFISRNVIVIYPNEEIVTLDYLVYFFKGQKEVCDIRNLNNIEIAIPEIEIQKKLVRIFDSTQHLLANRDTLINAADTLNMKFECNSLPIDYSRQKMIQGFNKVQNLYAELLKQTYEGSLMTELENSYF